MYAGDLGPGHQIELLPTSPDGADILYDHEYIVESESANFLQERNLYGYADNRPTVLVDPSGESPFGDGYGTSIEGAANARGMFKYQWNPVPRRTGTVEVARLKFRPTKTRMELECGPAFVGLTRIWDEFVDVKEKTFSETPSGRVGSFIPAVILGFKRENLDLTVVSKTTGRRRIHSERCECRNGKLAWYPAKNYPKTETERIVIVWTTKVFRRQERTTGLPKGHERGKWRDL